MIRAAWIAPADPACYAGADPDESDESGVDSNGANDSTSRRAG